MYGENSSQHCVRVRPKSGWACFQQPEARLIHIQAAFKHRQVFMHGTLADTGKDICAMKHTGINMEFGCDTGLHQPVGAGYVLVAQQILPLDVHRGRRQMGKITCARWRGIGRNRIT